MPKKHRPRRSLRRPPTITATLVTLKHEVEHLRVMMEEFQKHHAATVRRFAELQLEIDRLKGGSGPARVSASS
jgi:hypothetical protein